MSVYGPDSDKSLEDYEEFMGKSKNIERRKTILVLATISS